MTPETSSCQPATPGCGGRTIRQKTDALNLWRAQYNPLRGLTLREAVALSADYFRGVMADLQWTFFFIEQTDPDLLALVELRIGRLLQMDYNIKTPKHLKGTEKTLADRQAAFLRARFDAIDNLYEAIEHLGMAAFRGFAHCEKWYEGGELTHLEIVDQWNCVRGGLRGSWKYNPAGKRIFFDGLGDDQLMPPESFVFRGVRRPIDRIALFKFVRATLSEKDWDGFVEIYGIPSGVVIGPPNVPQEKEAEYANAAKAIAEGGTGFLPHGSDFIPGPAADERFRQPFRERLDHLSEKLVLAGTGGKLTMLNGPTGLGGGQSQSHLDVFETIVAGEARRISEVFNRQLVEGWLDVAFPGAKRFAYFELAANEKPDVSAMIGQINRLAAAGFQTDLAQIKEKTGYTVTLKRTQLSKDLLTSTAASVAGRPLATAGPASQPQKR